MGSVGAEQNGKMQPRYNGCRMYEYVPGVPDAGWVYARPTSCTQAWRRPNKSKWLMTKVENSPRSQPNAKPPHNSSRRGPVTFHTWPPSGCHHANIAISARLDSRT